MVHRAGRLDDRHRQRRAAAFSQTHAHIEIRFEAQVRQRDTRPLLRRIVGRDQIRFYLRRYLARRQRCGVGKKAIQHHRQYLGKDERVTDLSKKLLETEQNNIEQMKPFL